MGSPTSDGRGMAFGSFTDAGDVSDPVLSPGARLVDVCVSEVTAGTTVALQGEYKVDNATGDLSWETIESYTADVAKVVRVASQRRLRLNMTVDGGGTTFYELAVGNKE